MSVVDVHLVESSSCSNGLGCTCIREVWGKVKFHEPFVGLDR